MGILSLIPWDKRITRIALIGGVMLGINVSQMIISGTFYSIILLTLSVIEKKDKPGDTILLGLEDFALPEETIWKLFVNFLGLKDQLYQTYFGYVKPI